MKIDVYADIACPWCYIGMKRLQAAAAQRPALALERIWRPFQLQPQLPPTGVEWSSFAAKKFGPPERQQQMFAYVQQAGAPDGVTFRFDLVQKANNTTDAHRLVLWAQAQGRAWPMAEALFQAYFTDGKDLNDFDALVAAAEGAGFDGEGARALLASAQFRDAVAAAQTAANAVGVTGVPFYVFDDKYAVSGAQPVDVFVRALDMTAGGG